MRVLLKRWHDQSVAGHRALQHRMRRVTLRQRRRGNCRKPNRLADQRASGLLQHQSKLGEAETEAVRRTRHQHAEPAEFAGLAQARRRKARLTPAQAARDFRPRRGAECRGADRSTRERF